jgi:hypothetical protein
MIPSYYTVEIGLVTRRIVADHVDVVVLGWLQSPDDPCALELALQLGLGCVHQQLLTAGNTAERADGRSRPLVALVEEALDDQRGHAAQDGEVGSIGQKGDHEPGQHPPQPETPRTAGADHVTA